MKLFSCTTILSLALSSTLVLSGCNKADTDTVTSANVNAETAAVTTETTTIDTNANAPVASSSSSDTTFAEITASSITAAYIIPVTVEAGLTTEQKTCLQGYDKNLGVKQTQDYYKNNFTDAELSELNEFYSSDSSKQMLKYSDEQMRMMAGEAIANPTPAPTPEQMQEMEKDMKELSVFKKTDQLKKSEGDLLEAIRPLINEEFKRCDIEKTI